MFAKIATMLFLILETLETCTIGCLKCDMYNVICLYCDTNLNYTTYQGTCAFMNFPNCDQYTIDGMCITCQTGYYVDPVTNNCLQVPQTSIDQNCKYYNQLLACSFCKKDYYLTDNGCQPVTQPTAGCLIYVKNNPLLCTICETSYYLSSDQTTCFTKPSNATCMWYSNINCQQCQSGYYLDYNFYITALFDLTSWSATENFKLWSNNQLILQTPQCRATKIVNCAVFADFKTCTKCITGYVLSLTQNCVPFPTPGIPNCSIYRNLTTCMSCVPNYFLTNSSFCSFITPLANCSVYNSSASQSQCTLCISSYFLDNNGVCQPRTSIVQNCVQYNFNLDSCAACNSTLNLQVTQDGGGCLPLIVNCVTYDTSTIASNFLTCMSCIPGQTFNSILRICQPGTLKNCQLYDKNNVCNLCQAGYFLSQGICFEQSSLPNCQILSRSSNNTCDICVANSFQFLMSNYCFVYNVILYCAVYYDQNTCFRCNDYYYLSQGKCIQIPTNLNCIQYNANSCTKCLPAFFLNFGLCQSPFDYQLKNCIINNIDGIIATGQFQCISCIPNAVPLNLKNYYTCTNPNGASWLTSNCLKYSYNKQGRIVCDRCAPNYYVYTGTCVQACPPGTILYLSQAQGFNTLGQNGNNNFTLTGINICDVSPLTDTNCIVVIPGAVRALNSTLGTLSNNYVCAQCVTGAIKVVGDYSDVAFSGFDVSSISPNQTNTNTMSDIIDLFPGFTCIIPNNNINTNINVFTSTPIPFCEYYHRPSAGIYCCIKCVHGYSGRVFQSSVNANVGCLQGCSAISNCNANIFYKGLWQSLPAIIFSRSLLGMYFGCHACGSSMVPITIINFTTETGFSQNTISGTAVAGLQKLIPQPSIFATKVKPNWTTQISVLTNTCPPYYYWCCYNGYCRTIPNPLSTVSYPSSVCILTDLNHFNWLTNAYTYVGGGCNLVNNNLQLLGPPTTFFGTAADSRNSLNSLSDATLTQCLTLNTAAFTYILGNNLPTASNCLLYLANAMQYPIIFNTGAANNDLLNNYSVYCAACLPGFMPTYFYTTNMLPYFVYNCVQIPNCISGGGTWANFCSRCNTGFVYQFNHTKLILNFTVCSAFNLDPNCYAVWSNNTSVCALCNVGYIFNPDKICDQMQIPFCTDVQTFAPAYIQFNSLNDMYIAPLLLYFYPSMASCNTCQQNYIALKTTVDTLICVTTNYIRTNTFISNTVFKTTKCLNFNMDSSGNYYCYTCIANYIAATNGNCYLALVPEHNNCLWAYNATTCDVCLKGFVFVRGICTKQAINLCSTYAMNKLLTNQVCTACIAGYYSGSNGTVCYQGTISNCLNYTSVTECAVCSAGYQLVLLANSATYCIPIPPELKCVTYDFNFQTGIMKCSQCLGGYVNSGQGLFPSNYCVNFTSVENCLKYDVKATLFKSSFNCTQCTTNYYLSNITFTCYPRSPIDPNCIYLLINEDKCILCSPGYYIGADFKTCITNPTGLAGCVIYQNITTCLNCSSSYYMSGGNCVLIGNATIANCSYYSAPSVCTSCLPNFYLLSNGTCNRSIAANCSLNLNSTACAACLPGFGFAVTGNITNCAPFTDFNCLNSTTVAPFTCNQCANKYFADSAGICTSVSILVTNCISYQDDGVCAICSSNSILSIDKKICLTDTYSLFFTDPNCAQNVLMSTPICVACRFGYYFNVNRTCVTCGNNCAVCDSLNIANCLICMSGYYMDYSGVCNPNSAATAAYTQSSSGLLIGPGNRRLITKLDFKLLSKARVNR